MRIYIVLPVLLSLLAPTSCARKVNVGAPELVRADRYSYVRDSDGTVYVVTTNTKDFEKAIEQLQPGPVSVDKLNLWVITPLEGKKKAKATPRASVPSRK
jgi:hypothetical protein